MIIIGAFPITCNVNQNAQVMFDKIKNIMLHVNILHSDRYCITLNSDSKFMLEHFGNAFAMRRGIDPFETVKSHRIVLVTRLLLYSLDGLLVVCIICRTVPDLLYLKFRRVRASQYHAATISEKYQLLCISCKVPDSGQYRIISILRKRLFFLASIGTRTVPRNSGDR